MSIELFAQTPHKPGDTALTPGGGQYPTPPTPSTASSVVRRVDVVYHEYRNANGQRVQRVRLMCEDALGDGEFPASGADVENMDDDVVIATGSTLECLADRTTWIAWDDAKGWYPGPEFGGAE